MVHCVQVSDRKENTGDAASAFVPAITAQPSSSKRPSVQTKVVKETGDNGNSLDGSSDVNGTPANQIVKKNSADASKPVFKTKKCQVMLCAPSSRMTIR